MTDALTGKQDAQRILDYAESVAKEARKALIAEFKQKHKGIPFNTTSKILQEDLLAWYVKRDKNLKLTFEASNSGKLGEVRSVFVGESKRVRFKVHADATFSMAGSSPDSPCYLRELNVTVDKRAFSN
ncbi:MAG TPA: hypothetical protein VFV92_07640 [Candidatus Bathyarchaeia archaeon]|nr:hypothetical protein [Candidatus Bathyarchaeia archaeon]